MSTVAENFKKLRRALCLSQKELAQELGLTMCTISNYERGSRMPRYVTIRKVMELAKKNGIKITMDDIRPL